MREFNLLRYFALASLLVLLILAAVMGALFANDLERHLVREGGLYVQDLAHRMNAVIFSELIHPLGRAGKSFDARDPQQLAQLDAIVRREIEGFRVLTVNLFDTGGTIVYSTRPDHIGYRSLDNAGLEHALRGHLYSELERVEFEESPIRPGHDLLESYVPFREVSPDTEELGEVLGVLELYQDARPITREIARGRQRMAGATAVLVLLLFAALFEIVRRGHNRIQRLTHELERTNAELERRIEERTAEVVQSESLASLGEMAAGVAHEIRNPVGMITSAAQLLAGREGLEERDRELLHVIRQESERLNRTVSEFVNFAVPMRPTRSNLAPLELLDRVRALLRPEAERYGIELTVEASADLPHVSVDRELLHRALANLVLNAIQVQPNGGSVTLSAERQSGGVVLCVRDRGPGIPPDHVEKIFQPFFSTRAGGSGLGLAIVQRIAAQHEGSLSVSTDQAGSCFNLWVPEAPR